jgi:hypothetical protein
MRSSQRQTQVETRAIAAALFAPEAYAMVSTPREVKSGE